MVRLSPATNSRFQRTNNITGIETLFPKLGGLPLALAQAGAYLGTTGISVSDYLQHYDATWSELMLNQDQFPLQEYPERSVLTTWKMSYKQVEKVNELAARLLDLWAFLDHSDVWVELVLAGSITAAQHHSSTDLVFAQATMLSLQHAIGILAQYSMVNTAAADQRHTIHPVVHAWCLHNTRGLQAQQQSLLSIALRSVAAKVRLLDKYATKETVLRLVAHSKAIGARVAMLLSNDEEQAEQCREIAYFLWKWEKSKEVEDLFVRALRGFERAWGAEHTLTLKMVNNLGILYYSQGKIAEAEEMYLQAFRGFEKAWGAEHTSTLDTVNNLGMLYADQGKIAEAEEMYLQALRGYEKAWGTEHTSTLNTVNNLGLLYKDQGKMAEAEEMYLQALRGFEKAWGTEHTSTLNTVQNLGLLYKNQGKMAEAEEMLLRALRGYEKAWGAEHTSTLDTVNNLGILYYSRGKMAEAEEMYLRALRGFEKAWGAEHMSTLDTVRNLARLYMAQGKIAEAMNLWLPVVRTRVEARSTLLDVLLNVLFLALLFIYRR
jgi:tetratricopeptide (TPR) repeat protein